MVGQSVLRRVLSYDTSVLPVDGTYTIVLDPQGSAVGSLAVQLYDVPANVTTTVDIGGTASTLTVPSIGQNGTWTFTGTAGQRVYFRFNGGTFSSTSAYVWVRKPDGTTWLGSQYCGGSCSYDTSVLPVDGTYTIVLDPQGSAVGALNVQLYEVPPDATTSLTIGDPAVTLAVPSVGQNGSWTFIGTAGQRVNIRFTGGTFGGSTSATVTVRKPDGTTWLGSTNCGGSCSYATATLPADGTYRITLDPQGAATGSIAAQVTIAP